MSSDAMYYPIRVTWDEECSGYTPGARWVYGGEYYAVTCEAWVPAYIEELGEEEVYLEWLYENAYLADLDEEETMAPVPVSEPQL